MKTDDKAITTGIMTPDSAKMDAVGRLAGGVAHDFNNILGAIEGYATLILNTLKAEDPIIPDLEEIRKGVARAATLTRQLLVFSRRQALQKKICPPNSLIDSLKRTAAGITGAGVELRLDPGPGLPDILADTDQLGQLLMHLLNNSSDAMPAGGTVTVRTRLAELEPVAVKSPDPAQAGRAFIVISVSDTGTGMGRATLEHIFEPFFTTKQKEKGRCKGLGLSAVYGITRQHNGWVEVKSEEGKGAEFCVYLPAVQP